MLRRSGVEMPVRNAAILAAGAHDQANRNARDHAYVWVHREVCPLGRRALLRRVQIALKPASKTLGLHGIFIRGMGLKYVIADSAFKRMQVDARAC